MADDSVAVTGVAAASRAAVSFHFSCVGGTRLADFVTELSFVQNHGLPSALIRKHAHNRDTWHWCTVDEAGNGTVKVIKARVFPLGEDVWRQNRQSLHAPGAETLRLRARSTVTRMQTALRACDDSW